MTTRGANIERQLAARPRAEITREEGNHRWMIPKRAHTAKNALNLAADADATAAEKQGGGDRMCSAYTSAMTAWPRTCGAGEDDCRRAAAGDPDNSWPGEEGAGDAACRGGKVQRGASPPGASRRKIRPIAKRG
jgi:hypothetical protein